MNFAEILFTLDSWGFHTFQFIISFLWQSSIILAFVLLLLLILRYKQARARHIILIIVLFVLPFHPILTWCLSALGTPQAAIPVLPGYSAPESEINYNLIKPSSTGLPISEKFDENDALLPEAFQTTSQTSGSDETRIWSLIASCPWVLAFAFYAAGTAFFLFMIILTLFIGIINNT